ncbi:hypothetical protein ON010_g13131 [Phytophthora cinnamomi]|nr:hypothetical protein ON010_g13131 [Phytophthora cinnamomi]
MAQNSTITSTALKSDPPEPRRTAMIMIAPNASEMANASTSFVVGEGDERRHNTHEAENVAQDEQQALHDDLARDDPEHDDDDSAGQDDKQRVHLCVRGDDVHVELQDSATLRAAPSVARKKAAMNQLPQHILSASGAMAKLLARMASLSRRA